MIHKKKVPHSELRKKGGGTFLAIKKVIEAMMNGLHGEVESFVEGL